jgi:RNA polymerase sigma-70 factor (ECF subfamily)
MNLLDEPELAARAQAGDAEAFGVLVGQYAAMVRRVTQAVLRHPEDADDAAQDAFLAAWRGIGRFDLSRPVGPWLARIAINAAHDLRRRRRVRATERLADEQPGSAEAPDRAAERALLRRRLTAALATLPERQRLAVVLFDAEGFGHREIAELLDLPEGTVRSDVFHGRRRLRQVLGELEGDRE